MTARSDAYDRRQREAGEMTMVERVALALARQQFTDMVKADEFAHLGAPADVALALMASEHEMAKRLRNDARAAIAAQREATDAMVEAAMHGRDGTLPPAVVRHVWQVMCEAALAKHDADSRENAGR